MNRLAASTAAVLAAATLTAGAAGAQTSRISLEPRAGASVAVDNNALDTGFVLGGDVIFQATPLLGVYAGYSFNRFGVSSTDFVEFDESLDPTAEIRGFGAGVRATFTAGRLSPFFKAGLLYQQFELDVGNGGSSLDGSSDHELGFEIGGGVEIPLSPRLALTPGVSYNQIEATQYVRADVGLRIRL